MQIIHFIQIIHFVRERTSPLAKPDATEIKCCSRIIIIYYAFLALDLKKQKVYP